MLVADVIAFCERVAGGNAALVGHDWGGVLAWYAAARRPDLFRCLVVVNAPHPARYLELLRRPSQLLRSWYVAVAQLPWLPERLLTRIMRARLPREPRPASRSGPGRTAGELQRYATAFDSPEACRGPMNYYRAAVRRLLRFRVPHAVFVSVPTLLLWGDRDRSLHPRNRERLERWVRQLRVVPLAAGHWPHVEQPERVNGELVAFLTEHAR